MPKYLEVLTPKNSQIIFIDQQPQMAFSVQSIDRQALKNNVVGLAKIDYAFTMVHKAPERVKHGERIGPNPAKVA